MHVSFAFISLIKSDADQFTSRWGENKSRLPTFLFSGIPCFSSEVGIFAARTYSAIFDQVRQLAAHLEVF